MFKKNCKFSALIALGLMIGLAANGQTSIAGEQKKVAAKTEEQGHEAHHGGCLNAIETCEVGHAEAKIEGDTLKIWFVGGGTDTGKSVRVADQNITLMLTTPQKQEKTVILEPRPNELAEEKVGDCSYFEGKAPWLSGLKKFIATGKVSFKGKDRKIVIEYPKGYDPD